eukprot:TRINITY_DN2054_c0_g1_i1.p1 TRINITY_DN2054_c0_g1~~TRINITY_DN2054_c0_g1_i1.p1  ORF type:complete len:245 (-),score=106.24 TRINITY_DN2054_c0_g1_i1:106-840(-)
MGQCAKGAACPFSHQFVKAEDANKKSTEDTDKNLKFSVKNDSASSEDRPNQRNNRNRDESSNRSRDRDENSRHSDDGRQRRPRQEANVVFELPNSRKHEQRARSNSDAKQNNNNRSRDNNTNNSNNNNGRKQQGRQERDVVNNTGASFAASKEERQKLREQERARTESGQKASFGVQRLNSLLPGKEESVGAKRARDSAEESPNKRRKVESGAEEPSKDDLDRELDELNLPPPAGDNDEELLDI